MATTDKRRQATQQTLQNSIRDGACHSVMLGLTQSYIVPFALALRATTAQIGLLSSIPSLTMALSQLAAPLLMNRAGSRKRFILPVVLIHALVWLPILLIPYMFSGNYVWWLIGLMTLSTVLGSLTGPAWGSMMADLVPADARGRYFSLRNRVCEFVLLGVSFAAGGILQWTTGTPFLGFAIIFGGALVSRLACWYFISRMHEPPMVRTTTGSTSLLTTVKSMRSSNLGRFTALVALVHFATCLSGPFFAVYMLRELEFDYLTYVMVNAAATVATIFFLSIWGKRADRAGNARVIRFTSCLIPLVPVLWLVSKEVYALVLVQILSGFVWSGFNLASGNFLYDASPKESRAQSIAVFNAINGIAMSLGALAGGYLAPRVPQFLGSNLATLFVISGVLRMLVVTSPLRRISEVRNVPRIGNLEFLFGRPALVWTGLRSRLEQVILTPSLQPLEIAATLAPVPVPVVRSCQPMEASRSPPIQDDS